MIVAVTYMFHDHEPEQFILDTEKLDGNHLFEHDVKHRLENSPKRTNVLDGEKYNDDWGNLNKAKITTPVKIDYQKILKVFWDC